MDQNWDMDFCYKGPLQNQISCHLGILEQHAFCNMVGEQPLFYVDDSADFEDTELFEQLFDEAEKMGDEFDPAIFDSMRSRMDSYDRSAQSLQSVTYTPTIDLFDAAFSGTKTLHQFDDIFTIACQSGLFKSYFNFLKTNGVDFIPCTQVATATYDRATKTIRVNPILSLNKSIQYLSKSMRLAWHHGQGTLMNPLRFQPEDAVIMNRLIAADQDITRIAVAWELRLAGHTSLWNDLMTGADYDLCSAYAMEAMTNFRSIQSGLASRATFEKWFISGRCKALDRQLIQLMLGNNTDFMFEDDDVSRLVATDTIVKMGARPLGKNYLTSIVTQIMTDGLYGDVRDRANANFLWFVTFEKKMAQAEQSLQEEETSTSVQACLSSKGPHDADIITFPSQKRHEHRADSGHAIGASVYYIDHFRAL